MEKGDEVLLIDRRKDAEVLCERLFPFMGKDAILIAVSQLSDSLSTYLSARLHLPAQIIPCKKIADPTCRDKSIGSVSAEDVVLRDYDRRLPQDYIYHQIGSLRQSILRELWAKYKSYEQPISLEKKIVIVVSDGLNNSDAMMASLKSIKRKNPGQLVVALSCASKQAAQDIAKVADKLIITSWEQASQSSASLTGNLDHYDFPVDQIHHA